MLFKTPYCIAAALICSLPITLSAQESGKMTREVWNQISGSTIASFTGSNRYWQSADSVSTFSGSVAPSDIGDAYASRVRATLIAPTTGTYTFWISSDDESELWLSATSSKFGRVKIAAVTGSVGPQAWDTQTAQKSATISLVAGQRYFIEALHKDNATTDHLAIAWQAPGGARELIPASALESFTADLNDLDNDELRDTWEATYGFSLTDNGTLNPDQHPLADPDHDGYSNYEEAEYGTNPFVRGGLPGTLLLETWYNLPGTTVKDLTSSSRFLGKPDASEFIAPAATLVNRANTYGARMRGYVIAPVSGNYTFYVSGDDAAELWLSNSGSQFSKSRVAYFETYTNAKEWTKFATQTSVSIPLVAGQKYYIEALHKESTGGDHLALGWKVPGTSVIATIPASALESYAYDANDADGDNMPDDWEAAHGLNPLINDATSDLDQDGILAIYEYNNGTDPQVKNSATGALLQEIWWNVTGTTVQSLTSSSKFNAAPDVVDLLSTSESKVNIGSNFGRRMRGYVTAPTTGDYTFYVSGDDSGELWLSSTASRFERSRIAFFDAYTNAKEWTKYPTQTSATIHLVAGQKYFVEALQKESTGGDHLAIGWKTPGSSTITTLPSAVIQSYALDINDLDQDNTPDDWELAHGLNPALNDSGNDPDKDGITNLGEYTNGSDPQVKNSLLGALLQERWANILGTTVADLTGSSKFLGAPDAIEILSSAETKANIAHNYGLRVRGYVIAPATGDYSFYVSGDDAGELWLSTTNSRFSKSRIAYFDTYTDAREWTKFPSQTSSSVHLVAGQKYFMEGLLKESMGNNHFSIGWKIPGSTTVSVIPGSALESYAFDANDVDQDNLPDDWELAHGLNPAINDSAADPDKDGITNIAEYLNGSDPQVKSSIAGSLIQETWWNVEGETIYDLTHSSKFIGNADVVELLSTSESKVNVGSNFGRRIRGTVTAPETGDYTFYVAGDDVAELWLSSSPEPFGKTRIAYAETWTNPKEWTKSPTQASATIHLVAGQKYFIEALQKEVTGGDHLSIGWKLPSATAISTLPSSALASYGRNANDTDDDYLPDDWELANGLNPAVNDAVADPDDDGISNIDEYARGTDPQVKNMIVGGLLQEVWKNIPGSSVNDLTHSPKYIAVPDSVELLTSFESRQNIGEAYGKRVRGYLTAPETGDYTFWIASDDSSTLYLSTTESKFAGEIIASVQEDVGPRQWDVYTSQKSKVIHLVAGQRYFFEALQKDVRGDDNLSVAWQKPGGIREIVPGAVFSGYVPTAEDQDDDGLPDDWEFAHGLSPNDNGSIDPRNGAFGDFDGDGLDNSYEHRAGTRVDLVDTDGDGVSDYDEVYVVGTQVLTADAAPFETVTTVQGGSFSASSGIWDSETGIARQQNVRGWIEYEINVPASGVFQFELRFSPTEDPNVSHDYEFLFSLDGHTVRRNTSTVSNGASGTCKVVSPWLSSGSHTLRIYFDNSYFQRRIAITQLIVQEARGNDINENGIPDWVDLRLSRLNSLEAPEVSFTSPVCLEGRAYWPDYALIAGKPVKRALNDRWYVDLPLNTNEPTSVTASFENGGLQSTVEIKWQPLNLLHIHEFVIRQGDSLKLTAFAGDQATSSELVSIVVEDTETEIQADQPLIHKFNSSGVFPVEINYKEGGHEITSTIQIHVLGAPTYESPVCVIGQFREVIVPVIKTELFYQMDDRIQVISSNMTPTGETNYNLRLNSLDERYSLLRLNGPAGPILSTVLFRPMRLRTAGETIVLLGESLGQDQRTVLMPLIVNGIYSDVQIRIDIIIAGVIFADGALTKNLLIPNDLNSEGETLLEFWKAGNFGSTCHRIKVFQGSNLIAHFQ